MSTMRYNDSRNKKWKGMTTMNNEILTVAPPTVNIQT